MRRLVYILIFITTLISCNSEERNNYALEYQNQYKPDYGEIISILLSDTGNIFIMPPDYERVKRPSRVIILDSTTNWTKNRFQVSIMDIILYKFNQGMSELRFCEEISCQNRRCDFVQ